MLIIRNRASFWKGIALLAGFAACLVAAFSPLLPGRDGARLTLLAFTDGVFNGLAKGSSWFIPQARRGAQSMEGREIALTAGPFAPKVAPLARLALEKAGASAVLRNEMVEFKGDLGAVLLAAVADSDLLYHNDGGAVSRKYGGQPPLEMAVAWWRLLAPCVRKLQKEGKVAEAAAVDEVVRRAIEPANNFYGIEAASVADHIWLVGALLAFYILYTVWYGAAIYCIFQGLGLMEAPEKDEALDC